MKEVKPRIGTRTMTAMADSTAASDQTMVDSRGTGTPRSMARSAFSDEARMTTP